MTKAIAATRRNSILAAAAVVALGVSLIGCADSAALMYAHDVHTREVGAWCYAYSRPRTAALREDCIHRAWANVPPSRYWVKHHWKVAPCRCESGPVPLKTSAVSATGMNKPRQSRDWTAATTVP